MENAYQHLFRSEGMDRSTPSRERRSTEFRYHRYTPLTDQVEDPDLIVRLLNL